MLELLQKRMSKKTTEPEEVKTYASSLPKAKVEEIRRRVYTTFGLQYTGEIDTLTRVSARELSESKLVNWIDSYKALLKYVSKDYRDIFDPRTTGTRSGTRYHVGVENVVTFLLMFEENKL